MPQKIKAKYISFTIIVIMILLPIFNANVTAGEYVGVNAGINEITISTYEMTMKIADYKPNFVYWFYNQSSSNEKYCIKFMKIQEYFGTDPYLDSIVELGGLSYNLQTSEWDSVITDDDYNVNVNLTLSGLANNVEIQFLVHFSGYFRNLDHTTYDVYPFREGEIDIVVKNWKFTTDAKGIAIKLELYELVKINDVQLINRSNTYDNIDALEFRSNIGYPQEKASYKWLQVADYYNNSIFNSSKTIGISYFNETYSPPEDEITHLWLSYPKIADSFTINHTSVIGLNEQYTEPTVIYRIALYSIIGTFIFFNIIIIIFKKKK